MARSLISEFHTALGQYIDYRVALEEQQPERELYLATPLDTYKTFFALPFTQTVIQRYRLKIIVYDVEKEVIFKWQE